MSRDHPVFVFLRFGQTSSVDRFRCRNLDAWTGSFCNKFTTFRRGKNLPIPKTVVGQGHPCSHPTHRTSRRPGHLFFDSLALDCRFCHIHFMTEAPKDGNPTSAPLDGHHSHWNLCNHKPGLRCPLIEKCNACFPRLAIALKSTPVPLLEIPDLELGLAPLRSHESVPL